jgi:FlaA1/EpsC-like NDP-sugar epimerase
VSERFVKNFLIGLPRGVKQALMIASDTVGLVACLLCSAWILIPDVFGQTDLIPLTATTLVVTVLVGRYLGFYHSMVRYLGTDVGITSIKLAIASAVLLAVITYFSGLAAQPVKLATAYGALFLLYLLGSRSLAQYFLIRRNPGKERVIVYGAGEAGARVVLALQDGSTFLPVALIDDSRSRQGKRIGGLKVHSRNMLGQLIGELGVSRVLLALPSASRRSRQAIITSLEALSVHVQTIPDFNDLVTGKARVDDIREVAVGDLLGRDAVQPDKKLLKASVTAKSVVVTGAGGSIGSELCRQILRLEPKTLILFERSEVALYNIDKELRKLSGKLEIACDVVALLGSVNNQARMREIMQTFEVDSVYHAAAYKHVPVVEHNMLEGIDNNVFGTLSMATAAVEANVKTVVLISTDKAVSPTNVMGASKRLSELVLQAMQDQYSSTCFCMVRFGNVLESSGSVVPLFREQVRAGGPVTVTHRDIIRYFMTIPEAAQLVIQASAMAKGGDVFVLDMGDPVRIQDLARRMIHLMGLTVTDENNPDGDIEIHYTGLRPAEKLYEELLIGDNVSGTHHPRIMRANEEYIEYDSLTPLLEELRLSLQQLDRDRVRDVLLRSVSGYTPTNGIDDLVWVEEKKQRARSPAEKVVSLPQRSA